MPSIYRNLTYLNRFTLFPFYFFHFFFFFHATVLDWFTGFLPCSLCLTCLWFYFIISWYNRVCSLILPGLALVLSCSALLCSVVPVLQTRCNVSFLLLFLFFSFQAGQSGRSAQLLCFFVFLFQSPFILFFFSSYFSFGNVCYFLYLFDYFISIEIEFDLYVRWLLFLNL